MIVSRVDTGCIFCLQFTSGGNCSLEILTLSYDLHVNCKMWEQSSAEGYVGGNVNSGKVGTEQLQTFRFRRWRFYSYQG